MFVQGDPKLQYGNPRKVRTVAGSEMEVLPPVLFIYGYLCLAVVFCCVSALWFSPHLPHRFCRITVNYVLQRPVTGFGAIRTLSGTVIVNLIII